ncbi:hypothetical protein TYRP_006019 [Tyrophagus putrescentiae]|nr:hypothetical protein TYRP_006019 [Tyrophagus putrescentiae]
MAFRPASLESPASMSLESGSATDSIFSAEKAAAATAEDDDWARVGRFKSGSSPSEDSAVEPSSTAIMLEPAVVVVTERKRRIAPPPPKEARPGKSAAVCCFEYSTHQVAIFARQMAASTGSSSSGKATMMASIVSSFSLTMARAGFFISSSALTVGSRVASWRRALSRGLTAPSLKSWTAVGNSKGGAAVVAALRRRSAPKPTRRQGGQR